MNTTADHRRFFSLLAQSVVTGSVTPGAARAAIGAGRAVLSIMEFEYRVAKDTARGIDVRPKAINVN